MVLSGNGTAVSVSLFKSLPYDSLAISHRCRPWLLRPGDPRRRPIRSSTRWRGSRLRARESGKLDIGTVSIGSTQNLSADCFVRWPASTRRSCRSRRRRRSQHVALERSRHRLRIHRADDVADQEQDLEACSRSRQTRSPLFPEVPTIVESGLPDFVVASWNAVSVHAKTPRPIVERLAKEIAAAADSPDVKEKLALLGMEARALAPTRRAI